MSLFDSIRYPISDTIKIEEIRALPEPIYRKVREKLINDKVWVSTGIVDPKMLRQAIMEYEE